MQFCNNDRADFYTSCLMGMCAVGMCTTVICSWESGCLSVNYRCIIGQSKNAYSLHASLSYHNLGNARKFLDLSRNIHLRVKT